MKHYKKYFVCILLLFSKLNQANAIDSPVINISSLQGVIDQIETQIQEPYEFYGMANYFNQLNYFTYTDEKLFKVNPEDSAVELDNKTWLLVVGRYKVLVIQSENAVLTISQSAIKFNPDVQNLLQSRVVSKSELSQINQNLEQLRYHQLLNPLAKLTVGFEWVLRQIGSALNLNWGIAIILLALLIKIILIPVSIMTVNAQRKVSKIQAELLPQLTEIKAKYDGEEAHGKIMAAHKSHNVTPFYSLKPLISTLIQIPVLIAVFNVLGEMPELKGASFLWIEDFAYPDVIARLSNGISFFGDKVSLLPVMMTFVALLSTYSFKDSNLPQQMANSQRNKLFLMALVFFVLFYPFPSAMVFYWMFSNIFQLIQQKFIKI